MYPYDAITLLLYNKIPKIIYFFYYLEVSMTIIGLISFSDGAVLSLIEYIKFQILKQNGISFFAESLIYFMYGAIFYPTPRAD